MIYLQFLFLLVVYILVLQADAITKARRGNMERVAFFPIIPIIPLIAWGFWLAIDHAANPWGFYVIGGLHLIIGLIFLTIIVWSILKLKSGN